MAVQRSRCGHSILPLWFLLSFFFPSPILSGRRSDVFEFRMHAWNVRHAPRWKYSTQKSPKIRDLRTITQLCRARPISSQLRHVSTIGKRLLNSNISSTCPLKMVNVSPLTAEIGWSVWGTPANWNRFRVLASLLHRRRSTEVNQTGLLTQQWRQVKV